MNNILTQAQLNEIKDFCTLNYIETYQHNNDGTIDTYGDVHITKCEGGRLPIKFNIANGNFDISNLDLTTLENAPVVVNGIFYCNDNSLTSLEHCPKTIKSSFYCYNNHLTSLKGGPESPVRFFKCHNNQLTSLEYSPSEIIYAMDCSTNRLTNLKGCPLLNETGKFELNDFEDIVYDRLFNNDDVDLFNNFIKFQDYYEVWEGGFNEDNFIGLMDDLEDGLE